MKSAAALVSNLDPRLKMAAALVLGPCLWKMHLGAATAFAAFLFLLAWPLSVSHPRGGRMVRNLLLFVFFWVVFKVVLDGLTGVPTEEIGRDALQLSVRLTALVLLGLNLALSTSARALGLAVAWGLRPVVGAERAWHVALALALMVHFLPTCLAALSDVRDMTSRRCPDAGFFRRMRIISQAVIRNLGQKTWNQTLAVACRRLESADAWEADFAWQSRDSLWAVILTALIAGSMFL